MSLYDEIKKLDTDVADVYQNNINRIKSDELDEQAVMELFGVAYGKDPQGNIAANGDISANEIKALILIRDKAKFSPKAEVRWQKVLVEGAILRAIGIGGNGKQLKTDQDLNEVYNAIALAAASVNFISPRTMLTYDARQYSDMKALIKAGDIMVWDLQGVQLFKNRNQAAQYDARLNCLFLFSAAGRQEMIVHELAHAIQDWNDIKANQDWTEADAYIAQGLAEITLGSARIKDKNYPFKAPVDMVKAGKAKLNNDDWKNTYDAAAAALHTDKFFVSVYGDKPGSIVDWTDEETGTPEKDRLAALLKKSP